MWVCASDTVLNPFKYFNVSVHLCVNDTWFLWVCEFPLCVCLCKLKDKTVFFCLLLVLSLVLFSKTRSRSCTMQTHAALARTSDCAILTVCLRFLNTFVYTVFAVWIFVCNSVRSSLCNWISLSTFRWVQLIKFAIFFDTSNGDFSSVCVSIGFATAFVCYFCLCMY